MTLPREKDRTVYNGEPILPKVTIMIGKPGIGKTHAACLLKNSLYIDLENDVRDHMTAVSINVQKFADSYKNAKGELVRISQAKAYFEICKLIAEANAKEGDYVYKFISLSLSQFNEIVIAKATASYNDSAVGKAYIANNGGIAPTNILLDLKSSNTAWLKYYETFVSVYTALKKLAPHIIFIAHPKQASLNVTETKMALNDLGGVVGKAKDHLLQDCDAVGVLSRIEGTQTHITFKTGSGDEKSRCPHLDNQSFILVEKKDNSFVSHWDKIFPGLV